MVMELMHGGSLTNFLEAQEAELPWSIRLSLAEDIARGIQFLHHSKPIVSSYIL